jgi:hypothetical protein
MISVGKFHPDLLSITREVLGSAAALLGRASREEAGSATALRLEEAARQTLRGAYRTHWNLPGTRQVRHHHHRHHRRRHQVSPSITKYPQISPSITKHHQAPPSITKHHQAPPRITKHHQASPSTPSQFVRPPVLFPQSLAHGCHLMLRGAADMGEYLLGPRRGRGAEEGATGAERARLCELVEQVMSGHEASGATATVFTRTPLLSPALLRTDRCTESTSGSCGTTR